MIQRACLLIPLIVVISGCDEKVQDLCRDLPQVRSELTAKIASLPEKRVIQGERSGRKIASVVPVLAETDRAEWLRYSENWLKRAQSLRDRLEGFSRATEMHRSLGEAADQLVFLHGYAEQGDAYGLRKAAIRYQEKLDTIALQGCQVNLAEVDGD